MKQRLRIGSRDSALAVIQAKMLMAHLEKTHPELQLELVTMKTTGDRILDRTLDQVGGKGLFVKELDHALLSGQVDVTVHSAKDLPAQLHPQLPLVGFSKRANPFDVLVLPQGKKEPEPGLPIGSASPRRVVQLRELFPGFDFQPVRGNLQTRLNKLDQGGQYAALVLAAAGLERLGLEHRISRVFSPEEMLPAACQGILAVQAREDFDPGLLEGFGDLPSTLCATAERGFVTAMDGGCSAPMGAYGVYEGGVLRLWAMAQDETGKMRRRMLEQKTEDVRQAAGLGEALARLFRAPSRTDA